MGIIEQTVGTIMIGSWTNSALWALEVSLMYQYFLAFGSRDYLILRIAVIVMLISDTVCTVSINIGVYDYSISHWGDTFYLSKQHWHIPSYLICTAITALIVQSYLTHRYWRLSRNNIVSVLLGALTLLGVGANISVAVAVIIFDTYDQRKKIVREVIIWFCAKAVTDISIATALVFYLVQFRKRTVFQETRSMLVTMSLYAVETGAVTSAVALTAFGLFVHDNNSNAATAFGQNLGRLYAISMLFNLLFRKLMIRDNPPKGSKGNTSTIFQMKKTNQNLANVREVDITNTGVIINHQCVTHVDESAEARFPVKGALVNLPRDNQRDVTSLEEKKNHDEVLDV